MKKRKVMTGSAILLAVLAAAGGILAYLGASDKAENTVEVAHDKIAVTENFPAPSDLAANSSNFYDKEVMVENTGNVDCYVRVYADLPDSKTAEKSYYSADGTNYYSAVRDADLSGDSETTDSGKTLHTRSFVNMLNSQQNGDWIFVPDDDSREKLKGYFYYKKPLKPGEKTPSLFTDVMIKTDSDLEAIDLVVYAESTDSMYEDNGTAVSYADFAAAWNAFLN